MFGVDLTAIVSAVALFLVGAIKVVWGQKKKAQKRAEKAEAHLELRENVDAADDKIEAESTSRRAEAKKEIEDGEIPSILRNRNRS